MEFIEEPCVSNLPPRSRVKTLSVSGQLIFAKTTLLHASVLIEGNSQLHDTQWDYANDFVAQILEMASAPNVVVDEHHCD